MRLVTVLGLAQVAGCGTFVLALLMARLAKGRRLPPAAGQVTFFGLPILAAVLIYWQARSWWPPLLIWGAATVGVLAAAVCARGASAGEAARSGSVRES